MNKVYIAFLMLVSTIHSTESIAERVKILKIDTSASHIELIGHIEFCFSIYDCPEQRQEPYAISGFIEMHIRDPEEEHGFGNLRLTEVLLETEQLPDGQFYFPSYYAELRGDGVVMGDENFCNWPGRGLSSCYFSVAPGNFEGTFVEGVLSISGVQNNDFGVKYNYNIIATVVPIPSALLLMVSAIFSLIGLSTYGSRNYKG